MHQPHQRAEYQQRDQAAHGARGKCGVECGGGQNERVRIIVRDTLEELSALGDGGRQTGQWYGVHSVATDSKGNRYTTETYEDKRLHQFVYKGIGPVPRGNQGVLWPKR